MQALRAADSASPNLSKMPFFYSAISKALCAAGGPLQDEPVLQEQARLLALAAAEHADLLDAGLPRARAGAGAGAEARA